MANGIVVKEDGTIIATGEGVEVFRLLALRSALKMEVAGLKGRINAFKEVKRITGLKGTKEAVLASFEALLREVGVLSK